jgi:KDO2-lipid IV(A) lauroyltransferase
MKHRFEYFLALALSVVMRFLPRRAKLVWGRTAGSLVFMLDRRHRKSTISHVDLAFGSEKSDREKREIARGAYRHFGSMLFELISLGYPSPAEMERLVELEGVERFERARAPGKGVILTTGHFGNWELHGIAHGFKLGRLNVLARIQSNRFLNQWLENVRGISGNKVVYKEGALSELRRLLRGGETVALVIDQNVRLEDAVFIDFFGRKAATTPVPAWFALKTGAALVPAFCYPLPDGRYRAVYEEPIDCEPYRQMDRDMAILKITQELARVQETYIRAHPECWMWMHDRFRTRPPQEARAPDAPHASDTVAVDTVAAELP